MTITLINGSTMDDSNVKFDKASQTFTNTQDGSDITDQLMFADKSRIGGDAWDSNAYLDMTYRKTTIAQTGVDPGGPKDTSTLDALATQLYNDPLAAPLDQAGKIFNNTAADAFRNLPFTLTTVAVIAAIGFVIWKTQLWKKII